MKLRIFKLYLVFNPLEKLRVECKHAPTCSVGA